MKFKTANPLSPTTTEQEDITTAGQRRVNILWECTQGIVALLITLAMIYCAIKDIKTQVLDYAFISIVTMYFTRTNHTNIGGTGKKPDQTYIGR